ncbi:MAG TPA: ACT domain-containing protein [Burkholderiales bacterium]|nr:ACT domain-containing protein [Burkholderiales bacterium]
MRAAIVLTVIGPDRPGLVALLSQTVAAHEGNWLESRMMRLAGKFSGIVLVNVPRARVRELTEALSELEAHGNKFMIEVIGAGEALGDQRALSLELIGQDHPGIIRDISQALASCNINIEELVTKCVDASWSGESLFQAKARLRVPQDMPTDELRKILEALANELMVDITLEDEPSAERD